MDRGNSSRVITAITIHTHAHEDIVNIRILEGAQAPNWMRSRPVIPESARQTDFQRRVSSISLDLSTSYTKLYLNVQTTLQSRYFQFLDCAYLNSMLIVID